MVLTLVLMLLKLQIDFGYSTESRSSFMMKRITGIYSSFYSNEAMDFLRYEYKYKKNYQRFIYVSVFGGTLIRHCCSAGASIQTHHLTKFKNFRQTGFSHVCI